MDSMIVYVENLKKMTYTKTHGSNCIKTAGYKANM